MSLAKVAHVTTIDTTLHFLLQNQLKTLQQAGYEVAGISAPGPYSTDLEADGIRHLAVPMTRNFTPFPDLVSLWRLYRVMRRERFTIIHTHTPKPGLLGQIAARMAGVPVVVNTLHGFYFHSNMPPAWQRFYITLEKISALCSDVILSQNSEDVDTAIREHICPPNKIKYLGNGIDLSAFDPIGISQEQIAECKRALGIAPDAPVVGFVGRLAAKRKGFLDFLAAAKQVVAHIPEARFLVIGEADHGKPDAVEPSAAADYGIAEQCVFLGRLPNEQLPLYYRTMNLLVLPSLFEGVPRVVMEASAMCVPAIVTDVKGNREAVIHGRNGLLVKLGDVDALGSAIIELLSTPGLAQRMGEEGHRIAIERFDERLVFKKVQSEYQRLLQEKKLSVPENVPVPAK